MKATLKGKIVSVKNVDGDAEITFQTDGKVDKAGGRVDPSARKMKLGGTMSMKAVIANEMKIGAVITIHVSDEDADDSLD